MPRALARERRTLSAAPSARVRRDKQSPIGEIDTGHVNVNWPESLVEAGARSRTIAAAAFDRQQKRRGSRMPPLASLPAHG